LRGDWPRRGQNASRNACQTLRNWHALKMQKNVSVVVPTTRFPLCQRRHGASGLMAPIAHCPRRGNVQQRGGLVARCPPRSCGQNFLSKFFVNPPLEPHGVPESPPVLAPEASCCLFGPFGAKNKQTNKQTTRGLRGQSNLLGGLSAPFRGASACRGPPCVVKI